jgi:hypothetical protein
MPILLSPGCNCSCGCLLIEVPDYNTSVSAATEHWIPHSIPINTVVDLSKLVSDDYFSETSNDFTIRVKDSSGTTTHETIEFSSLRDTRIYEEDSVEILKFPYLNNPRRNRYFYAIPHYKQRGYKRYINMHVSSVDEDFETEAYFKILEVGDKLFRIKSVSAGTFNPKEGIAHSRLQSFNQITEAPHCSGLGTPSPAIIKFEKERYVHESSDDSRSFNIYRFHRNDYPIGTLKSIVSYEVESPEDFTWSDGQYLQNLAYTTTSDSGISISTPASEFNTFYRYNRPPYYYLSITERDASADVLVVSDAPQTGDGHFELETYKVNGLSGSSTTVKVFRTGGNSTAVDVVVAVGNTDVTVSFGAGDVVQSFTIAHDTHDGSSFTAAMAPTNDQMPTSFNNPLEIVFRENTYEIGNVDNPVSQYVKNYDGIEYWKDKAPFQRTGWQDTTVKVYVESNTATTLEAYKIYEISHDPTCQAAGDNEDCPDYPRCTVISEYHTQQFDVDVSLGIPAASMPSLSYILHDDCSTTNYYLNEQIDINAISHGRWTFAMNAKELYLVAEAYVVTDYSWPENTSSTFAHTCGDVTLITEYDSLPDGCLLFDTIEGCVSVSCGDGQYTEGTATTTLHTVTEEKIKDEDYIKQTIGSGSYLTACSDITKCRDLSFTSSDGLQVVDVKVEAVKPQRLLNASSEDMVNLCTPLTPNSSHREGDRIWLITGRDKPLEANSIWEWAGFADYFDLGVKLHDCTLNYVGQSEPLDPSYSSAFTPSEIATEVSSFLSSGGADYWFHYTASSNPSENGYYRVVHPSTLSGPFSTPSDGSGNDFIDKSEEVGMVAEIQLEWFEVAAIREATWAGMNSVKTVNETAGSITVNYKVQHAGNIEGPVVNCFGNYYKQDGYFLSFPARLSAIENHFIGGGEFTPTSDPGFSGGSPFSGCTPDDNRPTVGCVDSDFVPDDGQCWIKDDPVQVSGSCTTTVNGRDALSAVQEICCYDATPVYEVLNWSYYDFNQAVWSGEIRYTGYGRYYQHSFEITTGFVEASPGIDCRLDENGDCLMPLLDGDVAGGEGPSSLIYKTDKFYFAVKWGNCWTGMDARTETWDASTDTIISENQKAYIINSMSSGDAYIGAGDSVFGSGEQDTNFLFTNETFVSDVLDRSNIQITSQAFSPTWQKH